VSKASSSFSAATARAHRLRIRSSEVTEITHDRMPERRSPCDTVGTVENPRVLAALALGGATQRVQENGWCRRENAPVVSVIGILRQTDYNCLTVVLLLALMKFFVRIQYYATISLPSHSASIRTLAKDNCHLPT
jgi:hypothetical protein